VSRLRLVLRLSQQAQKRLHRTNNQPERQNKMSNVQLVQAFDDQYETPDHQWQMRFNDGSEPLPWGVGMWLLCGPDEFEVQVDSLSAARRVIANFEKAQRYRQGSQETNH
jgi:hypothetical protein